jgi:tRNA nucleotidyltransferase/poly(A) polymerase
MFKFYLVGGTVRDEILGLKSKDIDYAVVPSDELLGRIKSAQDMFTMLVDYLKNQGFTIFLITPDCYTIRAKYPVGHAIEGMVADFVMSRKEVGYIENTRTPIIEPGTLYDDLLRRDFTVNALAKDDEGNIIDYFNGLKDLENKELRTPMDCNITFNDDPLRILRAIRFHITKGFRIPDEMFWKIYVYPYDTKMHVVSTERIREELYKCFKFDTLKTLEVLDGFVILRNYVFRNNILWLKPTNEQ